MDVKTVNKILGITESYQAPLKMLEIMMDEEKKDVVLKEFLKHESDLSYEWFQSYFENEHADRKNKKQDFTPNSVSKLGALILGESDRYFEAAAGTGGMMIQYWLENPNAIYELEELSERAVPFLLFNMSIRNISGTLRHGDSLENNFACAYELIAGKEFSSIRKLE